MLKRDERAAILELCRRGTSPRQIANALRISRTTVKKVIRSASSDVPPIIREEKADTYRQEIVQLHTSCKGNLVRVHEELQALGARLSYPALTAYCRRHEIGTKVKAPAGQYHFQPGEEIQHDTSPHRVMLGGRLRKVETASAVLCYSRMLFFQCYPTFSRFECKVFLTEALQYFQGATERVMIDNTHVVVLRGTGAGMVPVPEMKAFAERFDFVFCAHEKGDANRSARVEGPFWFIENNFLAGRSFSDFADLNAQAREWGDKVSRTYKKHMRAVPVELYATERPCLKPLPVWIPEVYRLHHRTVDVEGYVAVDTNRYSAPADWIGHPVEVRETKDRITISLDSRRSTTHTRIPEPEGRRVMAPEHRVERGQARALKQERPEEKALAQLAPEIAAYVTALKQRGKKQITLALRQLLQMLREYPREALLSAISEAARYGLYDLDRVERMVLRRIAADYFLLDPAKGGDDHDR